MTRLVQTSYSHSLSDILFVLYLQGYWSRFFPVYRKVHEELTSGAIGDIVVTHCMLCIDIFGVERLHNKQLGGGALMDIGGYTVMLTDFIFNETPVKITSEAQLTENGKQENIFTIE